MTTRASEAGLHGGPPPSEALGDGFEPPAREPPPDPHGPDLTPSTASGLGLATRPVEPELPEPAPASDPPESDPAHLPVEPEFLPEAEPVEPEDPPVGRHRPF